MIHRTKQLAYLALRAAAETFAYLHIICYALYAGFDWLALRVTGRVE